MRAACVGILLFSGLYANFFIAVWLMVRGQAKDVIAEEQKHLELLFEMLTMFLHSSNLSVLVLHGALKIVDL